MLVVALETCQFDFAEVLEIFLKYFVQTWHNQEDC